MKLDISLFDAHVKESYSTSNQDMTKKGIYLFKQSIEWLSLQFGEAYNDSFKLYD